MKKPFLDLDFFAQKTLIGLVELMRFAHAGVDISPIGQMLIEKSTQNPNDANAFLDLSYVLQLRGNRELALQVQNQAIQLQRTYVLSVKNPRLRVLALMSAGDLMANTPIEFLLENSDIELTQFFVTPNLFTIAGNLNEDLPSHDVLFVAIAESEDNLLLLKQLEPILKNWAKPVVNKPDNIAQMARDSACELLTNIDEIEMPQTQRYLRAELLSQPFDYPIIIRPVDSHAGHDLEKIESENALEHYLVRQNYDEFFVAKFVDYRNSDGLFRKYRVMLIAGKPFLAHLAISQNWMIHYLNAGMAEDAQKREEEARVMENFSTSFARKHDIAFQKVYQRTGLEYVGLDCSETQEGKLLIFEIDSCMIVHAIDPIDLFPYKLKHMEKLFSAFQKLLHDKKSS